MNCLQYRVLALMMATLVQASVADTIKKTSSGILLSPPTSSYFYQIENFSAFEYAEVCLAFGGPLPRRRAAENSSQSLETNSNEYQRSGLGHGWDDADGDYQNSRMEALISQSTRPVQFAEDESCRVISGRWILPFTGNVITDASMIDIDHVVPLRWAWDHGAEMWSPDKRERFANDPINLWSVEPKKEAFKEA